MPVLAMRRKRFVSPARSPKPLIVRAGLARTFGSLGSFTAIIFLGAGIYLLREAFADPLTAQSVGVISGAVVIALATMLIYFLVSPRCAISQPQGAASLRWPAFGSRAQRAISRGPGRERCQQGIGNAGVGK